MPTPRRGYPARVRLLPEVVAPSRPSRCGGAEAVAGSPPLLCGIDAGTSHMRALVFAPDGTIVARAIEPTPPRTLASGWAELDAENLWRTMVSLLRSLTAAVGQPRSIRSVTIASVGEAGVLLGATGQPVAPIIAWYDTRTTGELEQLLADIGFEKLHRITGLSPDPTFSLLKLLWLKRHAPDAFALARHWLNIADYLAWRLCGERATDFSLASRTLLFDIERREWATALIEAVGLPSTLFAPLLPSGTRLGRIRPETAHLTGLPDDCVVGVGGHDHICGMLAVGADQPGMLLDSMGMAEAVTLIREEPATDPALGWDGFNQGVIKVDRPLYYILGELPTADATIEWFRGLYDGIDQEVLVAEAERVPCGSGGVLFLPHLRLGSPPFPDPIGRGAFLGLSATTSRSTLFRALLEGIALDGANILKVMLGHLGTGLPERIIAIGGGTRNQLLMRLKATAYGAPVAVQDLPDTTCLGVALLGGLAAGLFADLAAARAELKVPVRLVPPDASWDEGARLKRQAIYAAAYTALRLVHARLHEA